MFQVQGKYIIIPTGSEVHLHKISKKKQKKKRLFFCFDLLEIYRFSLDIRPATKPFIVFCWKNVCILREGFPHRQWVIDFISHLTYALCIITYCLSFVVISISLSTVGTVVSLKFFAYSKFFSPSILNRNKGSDSHPEGFIHLSIAFRDLLSTGKRVRILPLAD